jgi:hypothetical protein
MDISEKEVEFFREAYAIDFGEVFTDAEAREMLARLVVLYERLAEPLPHPPRATYT